MRTLHDKVAIVTGAGQGVGEGVALALADAGAAVVVAGRTRSKVERTAATIAERGGTATPLECDVTDADAGAGVRRPHRARARHRRHPGEQRARARARAAGGDPRSRCSRPGGAPGPLATFRFMRACYPHLKGGGVIVNMGSGSAIRPDLSAFGGYGACKEAIRTMSRAAACEWGRDGIRVNVVLPLAMSPSMAGLPRRAPRGARRRARCDPARVHRRCRAAHRPCGRVALLGRRQLRHRHEPLRRRWPGLRPLSVERGDTNDASRARTTDPATSGSRTSPNPTRRRAR